MKLTIINFGKIKSSELKKLEDYYFKLTQKYFSLEIIEVKSPENKKIGKEHFPAKMKANYNILLSEDGKMVSSKGLADLMHNCKLKSLNVTFFIGNAYGFDDDLKKESEQISLSSMTFPHEFVRVLFLEQLFRVGDILSGGKYHK